MRAFDDSRMRAEEGRPDFVESDERLMYRGMDKEVLWDKGGVWAKRENNGYCEHCKLGWVWKKETLCVLCPSKRAHSLTGIALWSSDLR